jgi:general secretion pathway protein A
LKTRWISPLPVRDLAGDARLTKRLRQDELLPLGLRMRLATDYTASDELHACLTHLLDSAGNPTLMSEPLKTTLCDQRRR